MVNKLFIHHALSVIFKFHLIFICNCNEFSSSYLIFQIFYINTISLINIKYTLPYTLPILPISTYLVSSIIKFIYNHYKVNTSLA